MGNERWKLFLRFAVCLGIVIAILLLTAPNAC